MTKYSQIPDNTIFEASGGRYRKLDALYFEDLQSGFQSTWNPMFDATISVAVKSPDDSVDPSNNAYTIDPQSRLIKRNPNYDPDPRDAAKEILAEMWGSAVYDCGPEDFEWIATLSVAAVRAMDSLAQLVDLPARADTYDTIVARITDSYAKLHYTPPTSKKKADKKSV